VEDARDAGANEFIVKPFTPQKVAQRLLSVINHPRDFYHCESYFGPDRRRRDVEPPFIERRKRLEEQIQTTFPTHHQPKLLRGDDEVWRYKLVNTLRGRVGGDSAQLPSVDKESIAEAGEVIRGSHADYDAWLARALSQLTKLVDRAEKKPGAARPARAAITRIAVDLRGHGVMFGYPLISVVGKSL